MLRCLRGSGSSDQTEPRGREKRFRRRGLWPFSLRRAERRISPLEVRSALRVLPYPRVVPVHICALVQRLINQQIGREMPSARHISNVK
jgi:hypothetical protein